MVQSRYIKLKCLGSGESCSRGREWDRGFGSAGGASRGLCVFCRCLCRKNSHQLTDASFLDNTQEAGSKHMCFLFREHPTLENADSPSSSCRSAVHNHQSQLCMVLYPLPKICKQLIVLRKRTKCPTGGQLQRCGVRLRRGNRPSRGS